MSVITAIRQQQLSEIQALRTQHKQELAKLRAQHKLVNDEIKATEKQLITFFKNLNKEEAKSYKSAKAPRAKKVQQAPAAIEEPAAIEDQEIKEISSVSAFSETLSYECEAHSEAQPTIETQPTTEAYSETLSYECEAEQSFEASIEEQAEPKAEPEASNITFNFLPDRQMGRVQIITKLVEGDKSDVASFIRQTYKIEEMEEKTYDVIYLFFVHSDFYKRTKGYEIAKHFEDLLINRLTVNNEAYSETKFGQQPKKEALKEKREQMINDFTEQIFSQGSQIKSSEEFFRNGTIKFNDYSHNKLYPTIKSKIDDACIQAYPTMMSIQEKYNRESKAKTQKGFQEFVMKKIITPIAIPILDEAKNQQFQETIAKSKTATINFVGTCKDLTQQQKEDFRQKIENVTGVKTEIHNHDQDFEDVEEEEKQDFQKGSPRKVKISSKVMSRKQKKSLRAEILKM